MGDTKVDLRIRADHLSSAAVGAALQYPYDRTAGGGERGDCPTSVSWSEYAPAVVEPAIFISAHDEARYGGS